MRLLTARILLSCVLGASLVVHAQTASEGQASQALVDHLVKQLESRERPAAGPFGSPAFSMAFMESEQQLRRLGSRASHAAPRVVELLLRTERHVSELSWTLWSISAEAPVDELPALSVALEQSGAADRLLVLAKIGRTKSPAALPTLHRTSTAADKPARLLSAIALGFQKDTASIDATIETLAAMLKDKEREVRQAALNGLRLQGPRASAATPALIEHLRTRDNVYMTTQVLAFSPLRDLLPLKPELEALLSDSKLTEHQKKPVVDLLLKLETEASKPVAISAPPAVGRAVSAQAAPNLIEERRGNVTNVRVEGSLAPAHDIDCVELGQAQNSYAPPDLHTGITKCVANGKFANAAQLFLLAGTYARYDAERIADRTAKGGGQVLIMRTFNTFSAEQKEKFSQAAATLTKDPVALGAVCATVRRIGPPSYFPKYLVLHGMNALTASRPLDNALLPDFDSEASWTRLQSAYLNCPKVERGAV